MFKRISWLLSVCVLIGLAGCDSTEPTERTIQVLAHPDTISFYYEDGYEIKTLDWFLATGGEPSFISLDVEVSHSAFVWDDMAHRLAARSPGEATVRLVASAEGYRDTTLSFMAVASPYIASVEIQSYPDTLSFGVGASLEVDPERWFNASAPLDVHVETDPAVFVWDPESSRLEAIGYGETELRVTAKAPQHREATITIVGRANGDFFPIQDGTVWEYDYYRYVKDSYSEWAEYSGVYSLEFEFAQPANESEWYRVQGTFRGTRKDLYSQTQEVDSVVVEGEVHSFWVPSIEIGPGTGRFQLPFPLIQFRNSPISADRFWGGEGSAYRLSPSANHPQPYNTEDMTITFERGLGIRSLSWRYEGRGFTYRTTWTRR